MSKKTLAEKQLDKFELLKGQIISGNDNQEIIKELKVLLIKLRNQKQLPPVQVNKVMELLLDLGY